MDENTGTKGTFQTEEGVLPRRKNRGIVIVKSALKHSLVIIKVSFLAGLSSYLDTTYNIHVIIGYKSVLIDRLSSCS